MEGGEGLQRWISGHKLTSIGTLWLSAVGASVAYSSRLKLLKPSLSLRLIHARMHAQALTLAVLSGAAAYHYYQENHHHYQYHHHSASTSDTTSPVEK